MRLIACAVLLAGTSLTLAACGGSTDDGGEPAATATEAVAADTAVPLPSEDASPSPTPSASATPTPTPTPSAAAPAPAAAAAAAAPAQVAAAAPVTAPPAFAQCKVCHSIDKGDHGLGPSLAGVYGTKAGEVAGFNFSDAMKNSGMTWNEANLDKFLESPQASIPGTKMAFAGVKDAARRKALIDYMKSL